MQHEKNDLEKSQKQQFMTEMKHLKWQYELSNYFFIICYPDISTQIFIGLRKNLFKKNKIKYTDEEQKK